MAWPSRASWAESRHRATVAGAHERQSTAAADYATPEDVAALLASLRENVRALFRPVREAKIAAASWLRQPGETKRQHAARGWADSDADRAPLDRYVALLDERSRLSDAIRLLERGVLPLRTRLPALAPLESRWEAERQRIAESIAADPGVTDDAAWAGELTRRASVDRWLSDPAARFVTRA